MEERKYEVEKVSVATHGFSQKGIFDTCVSLSYLGFRQSSLNHRVSPTVTGLNHGAVPEPGTNFYVYCTTQANPNGKFRLVKVKGNSEKEIDKGTITSIEKTKLFQIIHGRGSKIFPWSFYCAFHETLG